MNQVDPSLCNRPQPPPPPGANFQPHADHASSFRGSPATLRRAQSAVAAQGQAAAPADASPSSYDAQTAQRVRRWIESRSVADVRECRPQLNAEIQRGLSLRRAPPPAAPRPPQPM